MRPVAQVLASPTRQVPAQHRQPQLPSAAQPAPKQQRRVPALCVRREPGQLQLVPQVRPEQAWLRQGWRVPSPRQSRLTKQGSGPGRAGPRLALARAAPGQLALGLPSLGLLSLGLLIPGLGQGPPTVMSTVMWCQVTPEDPG